MVGRKPHRAMFSTTSTSHVLTRQSRAIVAVADTERHRFLAGTCCLREENEIHLIDFDEESNSLAACTVYRHPNEIWSISPNPRDASSFFTSHNTGESLFFPPLAMCANRECDAPVSYTHLTLPTKA